jgi:hypothetical protein
MHDTIADRDIPPSEIGPRLLLQPGSKSSRIWRSVSSAAVGLGLGAFALGSALANPYYYNPYPYGSYGYYPAAPAYYPPTPYYPPARGAVGTPITDTITLAE